MTPCEKLGYKVGDKFEHSSNHVGFKRDTILTLKEDDGSDNPAFYGEGGYQGGKWAYLSLKYVKPLTAKLRPAKQALADAIHASGKGWPDGANWAAQCKCDTSVSFYRDFPERFGDKWVGDHVVLGDVKLDKLRPNWHQTVLSREEYFSAYPEKVEQVADVDGWIEWNGGECPVAAGVEVEVKRRSQLGCCLEDEPESVNWSHYNMIGDIIAYRLHKTEVKPELCESVTRSIPDPDVPTTDRLLRKWQSAQSATREARAALEAAEQAEREAEGAVRVALGKYGWGESVVESVPVVTDWRDLKIGDEIEYLDGTTSSWVGKSGVVHAIDDNDGTRYHIAFAQTRNSYDCRWCSEFRFIRRP